MLCRMYMHAVFFTALLLHVHRAHTPHTCALCFWAGWSAAGPATVYMQFYVHR
jgi:hypothetical protein